MGQYGVVVPAGQVAKSPIEAQNIAMKLGKLLIYNDDISFVPGLNDNKLGYRHGSGGVVRLKREKGPGDLYRL